MHKNKCTGIFGGRVQSILFGFTCVEKIFEKKKRILFKQTGAALPDLNSEECILISVKERSLEKDFESEMSEQ